ncbi:hypothetical protein PRUPE_2G091100 [Prunus persica]|uniref:PREDICTED: chloroplast outer envelope n=2 Tax=Prunus TaxID=3754 RepID=A0A5E4FFG7_PRUDU|nr:uncharacterized protein LOC18787632 [Prunus persica]XP_034206028.1 uncharacterized protein LOC117620047 [Prunus dulcis]KAI5344291.1 hypothetical protein L3X38_012168 [Prunus dulcis]ONI21818.1 hypothetical protein PRUPE_2G091100 [Prunus persica]VVA26873.1 PREDICTED: chloroplast outer envelope [Prunus dulcis]
MAENTEIVSKEEDPKGPKNLFSLFPKFKLQFPFLKQEPKAGVAVEDEPMKAVAGDEGLESKTQKPDTVRFPKAQLVVPPPVAVENEEPSTKTSNPIILWQVYAIGGFLVLRWIWARWNERRDRKEGSSDDERSSPDDERSSPDE